MPTNPLDHERSRTKVCLICLRKAKRIISSNQLKGLKVFSNLLNSIRPEDKRVPNGICRTCSDDLNKNIKSESYVKPLKIPEKDGKPFCYSKEVLIAPRTRSCSGDTACSCLICQIAKANVITDPHPYYNVPFNEIIKLGAPKIYEEKEKFQWNYSLSTIENLEILKGIEPKKVDQFAGQHFKQKEASPGGSKYYSQVHGKPFATSMGRKEKPVEIEFTHDEMEDLAVKGHISQRTTRLFQAFINRKSHCKVQPGLQKELPKRNKILDEFYAGEIVDFVTSDDPKKSEDIKRPMVFCKNAQELIEHICEIREQDWHEFKIQVFLDGGGDMLKFSCLIVPPNGCANEKAGRKASGVNQLIPLAFAPKVPENYYNFRIFFIKTLIWLLAFFMSLDGKAKRIVCGMQNAACTYPCTDCKTPRKDFHTGKKTGATRTVSDLAHDYERYWLDEANKKDSPDYYNVIFLPLFFETLEEMKACHIPVFYFCPPSTLHHILGIVELYHDKLAERWPAETTHWVKISLATKSENPKMKFEGPSCIKLLESVNAFYNKNGDPKIIEMIPYLNALKSFNEVRKCCFVCAEPEDIDVEECKEKIEKFTSDSLVLIEDFDCNAINKLHECHIHLTEWLEEFKMGLGNVAEGTGESAHQDFSKFCQGRLLKNIDDPGYLECLRKLVVEYASKHRKKKLSID